MLAARATLPCDVPQNFGRVVFFAMLGSEETRPSAVSRSINRRRSALVAFPRRSRPRRRQPDCTAVNVFAGEIREKTLAAPAGLTTASANNSCGRPGQSTKTLLMPSRFFVAAERVLHHRRGNRRGRRLANSLGVAVEPEKLLDAKHDVNDAVARSRDPMTADRGARAKRKRRSDQHERQMLDKRCVPGYGTEPDYAPAVKRIERIRLYPTTRQASARCSHARRDARPLQRAAAATP